MPNGSLIFSKPAQPAQSPSALVFNDGAGVPEPALPVRRWDGSTWVVATARRWDGSNWTAATVHRRKVSTWA